MPTNPYPTSPRWTLAEEITDAVRRRYSTDVLAVGVHGAVAHGDDTEDSYLDLMVIIEGSRTGPQPATRRVNGSIIDLGVISAGEYLAHARTLSTAWPLAADQYLTARPTYDPDGWYPRLRDAHLARLAGAGAGEFTALALQAWYRACSAIGRARQLAGGFEADAGLVALSDARVGAAVVEGLLTRTYFRDDADAVRRTGIAGMGLPDLNERLAVQAGLLAHRGRPVDGTVADLFP
ncbi:nucleotidyltransferase domain-containing protein [Rugosimonospora acidiphila]|uniref:nucleotidyltransferase domain-containing protein n=1 Tax=Rugosimonospora acidiphila TaxID=556531 RepID=UPI0031EA8C5E